MMNSADRLLAEEHVATIPGNAFGVGGAGYVRMCYAQAYSKIEEALERMHSFMQAARMTRSSGNRPVVAGVER